ncbi:response regulator [Terasakiella sp. SH-1]|uniref:response regulator n=1 Tax=Terasakiella sp. SH-1 TaxID=2560057 RepID=UPI0010745A59|nr:response regulator [Terasakiella sp. SH-1]
MAVDKDSKIIIVDDYEVMTLAIASQLEILGFENVQEFNSAELALEEVRKGECDLVITDWNMEPMSGTELLNAIRADEQLEQLPVIIISAEKRQEIVHQTKKAGASSYLIKPFKTDALLEKIERVMG